MKRGHRRTQSAYVPSTDPQTPKAQKPHKYSNFSIEELVKRSGEKVHEKVVNVEKLDQVYRPSLSTFNYRNPELEKSEQLISIPEKNDSECSSQGTKQGTTDKPNGKKIMMYPTYTKSRMTPTFATQKRINNSYGEIYRSRALMGRKHNFLGKSEPL